jgi:hypothetical protein
VPDEQAQKAMLALYHSRMSIPKSKRRCAYCAKSKPTTKDHVVPKCMFEVLPVNMITVPACERCNKAWYDTYFRDTLVMDIAGCQHPEAEELGKRVFRSLARGQSEMLKQFLERSQPIDLLSDGGLVVDTAWLSHADSGIFDAIFRYLIRGLYYHAERRILPKNRRAHVKRLLGHGNEIALNVFRKHGHIKRIELGNQVFRAMYQKQAADPTITCWLLSFYGRVNYFVLTKPTVHVPHLL